MNEAYYEEEIDRMQRLRQSNTPVFKTVKKALSWYYEKKELSGQPRTVYRDENHVDVDCRQNRKDEHDDHLVMIAIEKAILILGLKYKKALQVVRMNYYENKTQEEISEELGISQAQVSIILGKAEYFIEGALITKGLII